MLIHFFQAVMLCFGMSSGQTPELSVNDLILPAGSIGEIVVSGRVAGESVYGVTILVELVPRIHAVGGVTFTAAPPVDIAQIGDPWPAMGLFTPFDTDSAGSPTLNGAVDDNGTFAPEPLTFDGELVRFPVTAGPATFGTWDVLLTTTKVDSRWEEQPSTLLAGVITVPAPDGIPATSFWPLLALAGLLAVTGSWFSKRRGELHKS
jgi:hypothetical protein